MRIFKATYKDRNGRRRESKKWYCEIRDHLERRRRLPAYENKKASEEFGRKLEALVACRLCGERPDEELRRWLEGLSPSMGERLRRWGILDGQRAVAAKPLKEHAEDYRAALAAKGDRSSHVRNTHSMILRILDMCDFHTWSDVSASRLESFLAHMRAGGTAIRTANGYLVAFKAFCKWCVRDRRIAESPVDHMQRLNAKTDVRCKRRALTADECRRLVQSALDGDMVLGIQGLERALLYRVALETGLRANELRSLTVSSFDFANDPPRVTVSAEYSKHRRKDVLPVRPTMASAIQDHLKARMPSARAFSVPLRTAEMVRVDLAAAQIEYEDETGRVCDFHALRHTFITNLANSGVHPSVAQALARHSTITLTMDRYTHTVLGSQAQALDKLPDLSEGTRTEAQATGTDDRILLGHLLGQRDAIQADSSRPKQTTGMVTTQDVESAETPENSGKSAQSTPSQEWWARQDSNLRPIDYESIALTN